MALQVTQSSDIGVDFTVAYARIDSIVIQCQREKTPTACLGVCHNAWINVCENGANPVMVIYNYLKTLPMFNGAIDV